LAFGRTPDRPRGGKARVDLVLYTSAASDKSQRAIRAIQAVLERYVASQISFSTCDLSSDPQEGDIDSVVFTPTLVKRGPGPRTSIIGNLEREDVLCDLLDASGVDRRWDD
jgi:circadian clock protein KaiB